MTAPKVSVVICFLNGEQFLGEAVDSVLRQTVADFELLLVDDGSTDESTSIARDHAASDRRVRYLEHAGHINLGLSASRNAGIRAANGTFIALLDADDVWAPEKLEEQLAIFDRYPELGMVCGATRYWSSWTGGEDRIVLSGPRQDIPVSPPDASILTYPLGTADAPCPSDLLLRRELVLELGGFEEQFRRPYHLYEDQAFLAKLYLTAPVYFCSRCWLDYRQHPGSIMATLGKGQSYHDVRRYFLEWLESFLPTRPQANDRVRKALAKSLAQYRSPRRHAVLEGLHSAGSRIRHLARLLARIAG